MSHRIKEEERIERIIRGLLKLPENKRCINCNSLGPQYVCTTFWTFVCTNCSGIHREFTHRIKSVSMAKFTSEEVNGLQAGGNERARQTYFKAWDPHRNSLPDGSNLHRLRDFIKHVYVDQKYTGERTYDKPSIGKEGANDDYYERRPVEQSSHSKLSMGRLGVNDDYYERRSVEQSSHSKLSMGRLGVNDDYYERCPVEQSSRRARDNSLDRLSFKRPSHGARDDFHERRSSNKSSPSRRRDDRNLGYYIEEGRSPRYRQQTIKPSSHRSRPARFEIVDDRFRDDSLGEPKRFESRRYSNPGSRRESRSPDSQRRRDMSSLPDIRPVRDILGDNIPALKVGETPKEDDGKDADGSAHGQKTASSTSPHSVNEKAKENETVNSVDEKAKENETVKNSSLIDFDAVPEAPSSTEAQQTQHTTPSDDSGNSFVPSSTIEKASTALNVNSLELLLLDLAPADTTSEVSAGVDAPAAATSAVSNDVNVKVAGSIVNAQIATGNAGAPATSPVESTEEIHNSSNSMVNFADAQKLQSVQHNQPSTTIAGISSSTDQQSTAPFDAPHNQWSIVPVTNSQGPPANDSSQLSLQIATKQDHNNSSRHESKSSERKELPADLFTSSYPSFARPAPGWQFRPPHAMGYGVQYHPMAMSMAGFVPTAKSRNPFDIGDDSPQVQATMFPSMSSLQGTLPNMTALAGLQIQSSPYALALPPQSSSYGMAMAPGQQVSNAMLVSRPQGVNSFGNADAFASLNPIQQSAARFPESTTPNSSASTGGNPFG